MVDTGYIEATDKIVLAGKRSSIELEAEEAAMKPGMLVKKGTTENEVKIGTDATLCRGWLGYEDTAVMYRPANIDTAYAINDRVAVINGPGMVLRAILADGTNVIAGNKLVGTAAGELKIWVPVEDTAGAGNTEEMVVAIALADGTTDGAAVNLIVRSLI